MKPKYRWYRHCEILCEVLQKVADGKIKRLMVFMPPRHGKSELISRLFSAYFLYLYPERWVAVTSYAADLAYTLSRSAQENYLAAGAPIKGSASAVKHWETGLGGGFWAAGVGGPATGKGWHLGIIDDPLKNAEQAASNTIREKQKEWDGSTWATREEPWSDDDANGAEIIVLTRWHEDDIAGYRLAQEAALVAEEDGDEEPERYHIVCMEAIKEEGQVEVPSSCTIEPDWRTVGEALCPERRPLAKLKRIAKRIGDYFFSALFQQKPAPSGGGMLKRSWFRTITVDQVPPLRKSAVGIDLAVTAKSTADYTVAFPLGIDKEGNYYLFRPARGQWLPPDARREIITRVKTFGIARRIGAESVAAQSGYVAELRLEPGMAGYAVVDIGRTGDKVLLAATWSPVLAQGRFYLVDDGSGWVETFLKECEQFPRGRNDDQIDAVGIAFETLRQVPEEATYTPGMAAGNMMLGRSS